MLSCTDVLCINYYRCPNSSVNGLSTHLACVKGSGCHNTLMAERLIGLQLDNMH